MQRALGRELGDHCKSVVDCNYTLIEGPTTGSWGPHVILRGGRLPPVSSVVLSNVSIL